MLINDTLIDPTAVQVISSIGVALCSVALLVGMVLILRVRDNISRAMLFDATFYPIVGVFLTTAMLRTTAVTFDIAMLAGLLSILLTAGLARIISRGRRQDRLGTNRNMSIASILVAILFAMLAIDGSLYLLLAGVTVWHSKDALSRLSQLSAGIIVGIPAPVAASLILEADQGDLTQGKTLTIILAVVVVLVVATAASEVLGHAVSSARDGSAEDYVPDR